MAFAINDKVTITTAGPLNGETGVIKPFDNGSILDVYGRYLISLDNGGGEFRIYRGNVEGLVDEEDFFPRTIKFEDIRRGDKIRVTRTFTDRSEITHTGYMDAFQKNYNQIKYWRSADGRVSVYEKYITPETVTYELLERKGKKLPTKAGSVIKVTKARGVACNCIAMLDFHNDWVASEEILGYEYLPKADIQEWEEMKVVPV